MVSTTSCWPEVSSLESLGEPWREVFTPFYLKKLEVICIGGSVVEFLPATREAGVQFPAHA